MDCKLVIKKQSSSDMVIALAGNPNVGKSTVFNGLTGLRQHTGNWPGKTVVNAQGYCKVGKQGFVMVDLPGCYSLMAHSVEEEIARDFICFEEPDAVVVVCDATCMERNLNLVLQTLEITGRVIVCVNLIDEAKRKGIKIDIDKLQTLLGVPVVECCARQGKGLDELMRAVKMVCLANDAPSIKLDYGNAVEEAIDELKNDMAIWPGLEPRWLAIRMLDGDNTLLAAIDNYCGCTLGNDEKLKGSIERARQRLVCSGMSIADFKDLIVTTLVDKAAYIAADAVHGAAQCYDEHDRRIDSILTSKWTGFPVMFALLALIFYITIVGANYPSQLLSKALFELEKWLLALFNTTALPSWTYEILILGAYRVLAWVVAVMLPPMAIFFPLFTLLEDLGYLPRIAFNLDKCFKMCSACGKQALTMWAVNNGMRKPDAGE
ncbi:MAG: ferrous iron transporter B [Clostridia bacterium]